MTTFGWLQLGLYVAVLLLLAQGHSNRAVAEQIGLSVKTVETYRARLGSKLGLRTRAALFRYAVETGILGSAGAGREAPVGEAPPAARQRGVSPLRMKRRQP